MTREEAIKLVKEVTGMSLDWDDAHYEALQMAIKALEQEPILDKIRAEINTMPCAITSMREIYVNRDKVINIIDKHKAESEE
jgi:hypothetical protein